MKVESFVDYESGNPGILFTAENPADVALLETLATASHDITKLCVLLVDIVPDDIETHPEHRVINGILQISPVGSPTVTEDSK